MRFHWCVSWFHGVQCVWHKTVLLLCPRTLACVCLWVFMLWHSNHTLNRPGGRFRSLLVLKENISLRLWSKGSFSPGLGDFSEQASVKERDKTLNSSIYIPAVGLNYSATLSLFFSSPLCHFSSPHLTLTAQPLCAVCSEASCILHGYNGDGAGGGGGAKRKDVTSGFRYVHWFLKVLDCIKAFSCMIRETTESGIYYLQSNTKDLLVSVHRQRRSS